MKMLVTADIHGNFEALTAVLTAAEGQFDGFICLGDMVGYGPDPEACVQRLRQLKKQLNICVLLAGNHEAALVRKIPVRWFSENARRSLKKTGQLISWQTRLFLGRLKPVYSFSEHTLLVHGSPLEPLTEYLLSGDEAADSLQYLRAENLRLCFCGHTHQAALYHSAGNSPCTAVYPLPDETYTLEHESCIVNPGSAGVPRVLEGTVEHLAALEDISSYPAYFALWDTQKRTVTFKQVRYDARITDEKNRRVMGVPLF